MFSLRATTTRCVKVRVKITSTVPVTIVMDWVVVSEIGPDFSPDIESHTNRGFSPR